MKKVISIILSVFMLISLMSGAFITSAADYPDMPGEKVWSYNALKAAVENGLLNGSNGKLLPNDKLTRAQMAAIINRAFGAVATGDISSFTDVPAKAWYTTDIAKAVRMGTFKGDGTTMRPNSPISRQEAFAVLARAFKLENGSAASLERFKDHAKVSKWAVPELSAMVEAGYVAGNNGNLNATDTITRAEFAQVMYNMIKGYFKEPGTYTSVAEGNVMINTSGVTLKDVRVSGDLIVGEGADQGDVYLDNVTIEGRLLVRGGGEKSVHIINNSSVGSVLISKTGDGGVRIRTEEGCDVSAVYVDDGNDGIIIEGEYNQVVINTDTPVNLNDTNITGLTIRAENAAVEVTGESEITTVVVEDGASAASVDVGSDSEVTIVKSNADAVKLSGEGKVSNAEISGNGTEINTQGTNLTVSDGTEGVTENGKDVSAGTTVITGDIPQHIHVWGEGVVTKEPGCEENGVRTYTCECGEQKTEEIAALGHQWNDGVFVPSETPGEQGTIIFTCARCGKTRTVSVSETPYAVKCDETLRFFATFDEAMAESEKYVYTDENSGDQYYADIFVGGSAVIKEMKLDPGHFIYVINGGSLTVTDSLVMSHEPRIDAVMAELRVQNGGMLTVGDVMLTGETGAFVPDSFAQDDEDQDDTVLIIRTAGNTDTDKPELWTGNVVLVSDVKISDRFFSGLKVEWDACMTVLADLDCNTDIFTDGSIAFISDGQRSGSLSDDGIRLVGFTDEYMISLEDQSGVIVLQQGRTYFHGSDVTISKDCEIYEPQFGDEPGDYTVTIAGGAEVVMYNADINSNITVPSGSSLRLEYDAYVRGTVENHGTIENNGNLTFGAGGLNNAEDGKLTNRSIIGFEMSGNLYSKTAEDEDYTRIAEANDDATFVNKGVIINEGDLHICCFSPVNDGTINNKRFFELYGSVLADEYITVEETVCSEEYYDTDDFWDEYARWMGPIEEEETGDGRIYRYYRIAEINTENAQYIAPEMTNNGIIINSDDLRISSATLVNNGDITNDRWMHIQKDDYHEYTDIYSDMDIPCGFTNNSLFTNGSSTDVGGEYNGSEAYCEFEYAVFENNSEIINNGYMNLRATDYKQTEDAKMVTYNASGFEVEGGSLDIPSGSEFRNEGYMKITDCFGFGYGKCDISEFDDFFTTWNVEENDSNWCDFTAAAAGTEGYYEAVEEQGSRPENMKYNRLDFRGDVTFEEDVVFDDFRDYWIVGPYNMNEEDLHGTTVTVVEGATLTVAGENILNVEGNEWGEEYIPSSLVIKGSLVIEPEREIQIQEDWWEHYGPGYVDIWPSGSFVSTGSVDNQGEFVIRYEESSEWAEEDNWGYKDYNGEYFYRDEACAVSGAPDNSEELAEVRTEKGFNTAIESSEPEFERIHIAGDCCVTVSEDMTVPEHIRFIDIDPGSGFIVEHGATLILECGQVNNNGDISVYGDMVIRCDFHNNQSMEIGAVGTEETATVTVERSLWNNGMINIYDSGSLIAADGSHITDWSDEYIPVTVLDGTLPECLENVSIKGALNIYSDQESYNVLFESCRFDSRIQIFYTTGNSYTDYSFRGDCIFEDGASIYVETRTETDFSEINDVVNIYLDAPCDVWSSIPVRVDSKGSFTLNGITCERDTDNDDAWFNCSIRYEDRGDDGWHRVFQADSDSVGDGYVSRISGTVDYDELRIMQGSVDISGIDLADPDKTNICINNIFGSYMRVNIGSNTVTVNQEGEDGSVDIKASEGAVITYYGCSMSYVDGDYNSTSLDVSSGDNTYYISPHIFGTRSSDDIPAVYIGIASEDVEYIIRQNGREISYDKEIIDDEETGTPVKTHLVRPEGSEDWFEAGVDTDPGLELEVRLPEGVTVIFTHIPVKPEWEEN